MAEVIIPPEELEPELPEEQLPEVEKPTEKSKVISVNFDPLNTKQTANLDTRESFYTTDTDAWIVLNVGDMNEPTGQYSLALINKEDGSIFQRVGDIVRGVAYYKLLPNEIKHAGRWVGQAVITLANGQTTASRFSFNVSGHILDGKDVREIVIQDFQTLMAQLNDLKDNATNEFGLLKNEIEAFQTTIQENEDERQATELDRVAAELSREETYDSKVDAAIVEADVVTKVDDKVAELSPTIQNVTAQLAQTQKDFDTAVGAVTVDSEVVLARGDENTLGNRLNSIEKDVVVEVTNQVVNGDFSKGTTGWASTSQDNIAIIDKVLMATVSSVSGTNAITHKMSSISKTDIHYLSFKFMPFRTHVPMILGINRLTTPKEALANTTNKISLLYTPVSLDYSMTFRLNRDSTDSMLIGNVVEFSNFIDINLTATFGAGNEPTVTQMDRLLEQFPNSWFDGTVNIYNSKHMMGMLFKELTKLNNAIIALGGNV